MRFEDFVEINPKITLQKGEKYPRIMMGQVTPGRRYVYPEEGQIYKGGGSRFTDGDTLFARITPCLENGKIAQYKGLDFQTGFGSTEFFVFRAREGLSDPAYVYYLSQTDAIRKPAEKSMFGASGRQRADLNVVKCIEVSAPSLPVQHKIAAILSAYDDMIENNTRRIQILEEMAQAIYREWFIHFRFPGYENMRMVDSGTELGEIPEEWEVSTIDDALTILGGGTPSTKVPEYWGEGIINWYAPKDLTATGTMYIDESPRKITDLGLQKSSAKLFPAYSVMMTSRATLGVTAINTNPASTNQGFIVFIPNQTISALQIYFWIENNIEKIISIASGATFKEISKTTMRTFLILIAEASTRERFDELTAPMGDQIEFLQRENDILRSTRDLLLPKLIRGEINISKAEINRGNIA